MQSASSRILIHVALSISNNDNHYTTGTSGMYLLLVNKQWTVLWGTERMLQRILRHKKVILHRSAHPQRQQNRTEKSSYGLDWLHKNIYDMVQQIWIINCLKMYKISHEVINFIEKTMKTWKVELTAGGRSFVEAKVQRSIFQRDGEVSSWCNG